MDIGSGSGCLAISADLMFKHAEVTAWDVCDKALHVAGQNNENLGASVQFQKKDALIDESWSGLHYDVILSNPPYISQIEIDVIAETLGYEPKKALFAENDGLIFYEKIADVAGSILSPNGYIIMEWVINKAICLSLFADGSGKLSLFKIYLGMMGWLLLIGKFYKGI